MYLKFIKSDFWNANYSTKKSFAKGGELWEELENINCKQNPFGVTCDSKVYDASLTFIEEDYPYQVVSKSFL